MDIENGIRKGFNKQRAEESHEARQTNETDVAGFEKSHQLRVVILTACKPAVVMIDHKRFNSLRRGDSQSFRITTVGNDQSDLCIKSSLSDCIDNRFEIASTT